MNKILLSIFLLITVQSFSQIKTKNDGRLYAGLGYSLLFFTNPDVSNIYPSFDLNNSGLLSEVNGFIGYRINNQYAFEFSPSVMYEKSKQDLEGFWSVQYNQRLWYVPQDASLLSIVLNLKARVYPFASNGNNILKDLYFGIGGGMIYFDEQYTNYLYNDSTFNAQVVTVRDDNNSVLVPNLCFSFGFESGNNFGYGFDIGYRIVPMPVNRNTVLSTSNAGNFNSVNLTAKILFNFQ